MPSTAQASSSGTKSPTVLVAVSSGAAARLLLQTDIPRILIEGGARVVALIDHHDLPAASRHAPDLQLTYEPLRRAQERATSPRRRWARSMVRILRRQSLSGRHSAFYRAKYGPKRARLERAWPRRIAVPLHLITTQGLWRSRRARRGLLRADLRLSGYSTYADLFKRHKPDLVVAASPGWFQDDEVVLQEASRRGIAVAAVVHGWDNASSKGYRAVNPELVLAWSDHMRDELIELQDLPPERVRVAGVPHWDHYFRAGGLPAREAFFSELGLDPSRRLVVYATPSPGKRFPDGSAFAEDKMVRALVNAIEQDEFGPKAQLVVRVHPKAMKPELAAHRLEIEAAISGSRHVHVEYPRLLSAESPGLHDYVAPEDARALGGLMKHCDALVNMFSTTTLEAIANDRPVVMIGRSAYLSSAERERESAPDFDWEEFEHLRPITDNQAAQPARCWEEVVAAVRTYLEDPARDREGRERIAETELGPLDGRSGSRAASYLLDLLGTRQAES